MIYYHMMAKVKSAMDQYVEGLKIYGLLDKIQTNPDVWRPMFMKKAEQLNPGS